MADANRVEMKSVQHDAQAFVAAAESYDGFPLRQVFESAPTTAMVPELASGNTGSVRRRRDPGRRGGIAGHAR